MTVRDALNKKIIELNDLSIKCLAKREMTEYKELVRRIEWMVKI